MPNILLFLYVYWKPLQEVIGILRFCHPVIPVLFSGTIVVEMGTVPENILMGLVDFLME